MKRDRAPQASYLQKHKPENKSTTTNNNAIKTDGSSRKSVSNNGKSSGNSSSSGGGGMIAKFIDLDDIPDGLPLSPSQQNNQPTSTFPRNIGQQFYAPRQQHNEVDEEEDEEEDNVNHYTASRTSPVRSMAAAYPSRPPPLPHEEQYTARSTSSNAYPTLASADSGGKKPLPMVYPKNHNSPVKLSARQQDIDWDDEDDDDDDDRFDDGFGNIGGCSRLTTPSTSRSQRQQHEVPTVMERRIPMVASNKQQQPQPPTKNVIKTDHKHEKQTQQYHGNDKQTVHSSSYNKPTVVHSSFGTTGGPPKLPYEVSPHDMTTENKGELSEKDQLYFSKQPRAVDYRPYTLGQYKQIKPKEYMEIDAHLKPDLNNDVLLAKRANYERVKEFSKQLKDFNRSSLQEQRKLPYSSEVVGIEMTKKRLESNRERALQFSKHIPKPKTKADMEGKDIGNGGGGGGVRKTNDYHDDDDDYDDGYDDSYVKANDQYGPSYESAMRLQVLQAKHNDNRRNIQAIKKSVGI